MTLQRLSCLGAFVIFSLYFFAAIASAQETPYSSSGCAQDGVLCGPAIVDQISGNVSIIQQDGYSSRASVEQQAILGGYANAASIQQSGSFNSASISQSGSQNAAAIAQSGNNDSASVGQNGTNLGVQVSQFGNNSTIGVTQFGNGTPGAQPITIRVFK